MVYIAHTKEDGSVQSVREHLLGTAALAEAFASQFNAAEWGKTTGLMHDAGKYSKAFQKYILDPAGKRGTVDHSTAGAQIAWKKGLGPAAFAVAGHHAGLPDGGSRLDTADSSTLCGRMKRPIESCSEWEREISPNTKCRLPFSFQTPYDWMFFTRMLYSCLVDADYLDTERFMQGESGRKNSGTMQDLLALAEKQAESWLNAPITREINTHRNTILKACIENGKTFPRGLYTLTVPTGGGKTFASLMFALEQAVHQKMERIIYVIPYTSIIDQTAEKFSEILGSENVLAHHSGAEYQLLEKEDITPENQKKALAAENWDARIVVTTAVQFFESLYAAKPSRCRKLHHIANSVIVFDEAQTIPMDYLKPCLAAIAQLTEHYRASILLCTATQPAFDEYLLKYLQKQPQKEICPQGAELFEALRRNVITERDELDEDSLAEELSEKKQVLCVVNRRKTAQELYERLPEEGRYCLTTLLCAADRKRKLKEIRQRLAEGKICRVVSTSLIEAGVDVDFPCAYREEAGLDSILQTAGRCNREGKRPTEESTVSVFTLAGERTCSMVQQKAAALKRVRAICGALDAPETVEMYFKELYKIKGEKALDRKDILGQIKNNNFPFETIAEEFKLIEAPTKTVYIPLGEGAELCRRLKNGEKSRALFRALGTYSVEIYPEHFDRLYQAGGLELLKHGEAILTDMQMYDAANGLKLDVETGAGIFI